MRYVVVGTSGAGKSTFARRLASIIGGDTSSSMRCTGMRTGRRGTHAEFEARVAARTAGERWVADGNYSVVRHVVWTRATDIVWLNFSRTVVFSRVIRRTLRRATLREELWSGNRESLRQGVPLEGQHPPVVLHDVRQEPQQVRGGARSGEYPHLRWHELRSPREARKFLRAVRLARSRCATPALRSRFA